MILTVYLATDQATFVRLLGFFVDEGPITSEYVLRFF